MSESLTPNNGEAFVMPQVPEERQQEERKEQGELAFSYPVLPGVLDWFEQWKSKVSNLNSIQMQSLTMNGVVYDRVTSVEAQVLAAQLISQAIDEKTSDWRSYVQEIEQKKGNA